MTKLDEDDLWEARVKLPLPSQVKAVRLSCVSWLRVSNSERELYKFTYEKEYIGKGKSALCIGWKLKDISPK